MATYESAGVAPKIKLYTNHICPYAHRAHCALRELGIPYDEVIIDLEKPREQWYLDINPRGLVPTIEFSNGVIEDEIVTESAIVAQFLCDTRPSHLLPGLSDPKSPLVRARINYFTDTWNGKIGSYNFAVLKLDDDAEKETKCKEWFEAIKRDIEPQLKDCNPFFGGSTKMTLAEVIIAPFLIRAYTLSNDGKMIPKSFVENLATLPNFSKWANATMAQDSVKYVYDESKVLAGMSKTIANWKAQK